MRPGASAASTVYMIVDVRLRAILFTRVAPADFALYRFAPGSSTSLQSLSATLLGGLTALQTSLLVIDIALFDGDFVIAILRGKPRCVSPE